MKRLKIYDEVIVKTPSLAMNKDNFSKSKEYVGKKALVVFVKNYPEESIQGIGVLFNHHKVSTDKIGAFKLLRRHRYYQLCFGDICREISSDSLTTGYSYYVGKEFQSI